MKKGLITLFFLLVMVGQGFAADWPSKAINLVVPYGAGGNSDFNARAISKYLPDLIGVPVVVTNVPGSGGTIGAAQVKNAKPDGYNILIHQLSLSIAEAAGMVNYGIKDFEIGCILSNSSPEVLVSLASAPYNNIEELIAYTKQHPGSVKLTANTGATTMWTAIGLLQAGANLNIVSSGGSGERLQVVLGGHAEIVPLNYDMIEAYVNNGTLKILGSVSDNRSELIPDVKTLRESGVNVGYDYMNTMFFPKGTDPQKIEKLCNAVGQIVNNNESYRAEVKKAYQPPTWKNEKDSKAHWYAQRDELMAIKDTLQGK
jgi:tripartite-type tricarboxylate transporter receptor subunit TctC